jgi:hypothetical protein
MQVFSSQTYDAILAHSSGKTRTSAVEFSLAAFPESEVVQATPNDSGSRIANYGSAALVVAILALVVFKP